jgi:hypothetical protein
MFPPSLELAEISVIGISTDLPEATAAVEARSATERNSIFAATRSDES